jgi:hypothetical protein
LSGIMNQQDQNRTVVLHHIPRPKEVSQWVYYLNILGGLRYG